MSSQPPPPGPSQQPAPDLHVRQHERLECRLTGYAQIAPESAQAVRIARAAAQTEGVSVAIVDCSAGGVGLRSDVFLPRNCRLYVQASVPTVESPGGTRALEAPVRVQRVAMVDRRPTYYIGASFLELTEEQHNLVDWLLHALRNGRVLASPLSLPTGSAEGPAGPDEEGARRAV